MSDLFIGLMSGTSMDAIDAALVDFTEPPGRLVHTVSHPIPEDLRGRLIELAYPGPDELNRLGQADIVLGRLFADAARQLLNAAGVAPEQVAAIGSHGQTVRHHGDWEPPFTLQIGDPNTIAEHTGVTTVADFRRRDMAAGGQGAPLVPAFHEAALRSRAEERVVLNLGGMANITHLPRDHAKPVIGFDTGPGNALMDAWANRHLSQPRDEQGAWARSGQVIDSLLTRMMADGYFKRPPPKSTGREYFNLPWLESYLSGIPASPEDVQATLAELTAASVAAAVRTYATDAGTLLVCGGGVHNSYLMERIQLRMQPCRVKNTAAVGLDPDWVEATAFAWLARQRLVGGTGNLPSVTGAHAAVILGGIYPGRA